MAGAGDSWDPFGQLQTDPAPRKRKPKDVTPADTDSAPSGGAAAGTPEYGTGIPYGGTNDSPAGSSTSPYGGAGAASVTPVPQPEAPAAANNTSYGSTNGGNAYGGAGAAPAVRAAPSGQPAAPNSPQAYAPTPPAPTSGWAPQAVEAIGTGKGELAPVASNDGSGLPYELWTGLDLPALEGAISKAEIPPRSPAIHQLWRRLITSHVSAPSGVATDPRFNAVRADALYRSGLLDDAEKAVFADPAAVTANPALGALAAKIEIGRGEPGKACEIVKGFIARKGELPKKIQGEALLMTGICAAVQGNPRGAGLAAEFAREDKSLSSGPDDAVSLAALDAIASGHKASAKNVKSLSLLQFRAFELAGGVETRDLVERGEPALLAALALDPKVPPPLQVAAGEAAARVNAISPDALANLYRTHGAAMAPEALQAGGKSEGPLHRAALFKAAEAERTPLKKVRILRALVDDAKRAGLYLQTLSMLAPAADTLQPVPEIGWFAETGIEIALAANNPDRARLWSNLGGSMPGDGGLRHWQALIDIADPNVKTQRGRSLASVEDLAARGRLSGELLNRLATVLDANDVDVPLPLWEAASKAPQPTGGYLPETGVLTTLQEASKKKEFGRTVLLVMRSLGPAGAEAANLISLGDSIRALRRAGLDPDARRLSFEALFAQWPRSVSN